MIGIGIDIGSTAAKAAVVDGEGSVAWTCVQPTGFSSVDASERLREALAAAGYDVTGDDVRVVATGYGRVAVPYAHKGVTEITCHGTGAVRLFGDHGTVIDVGGQDTKVIQLKGGRVVKFAMNDKCAAGTGRFLAIMADRLGISQQQMADLARSGEPTKISSMCTVFAESEVISLIGRGEPRENIARGVIDSVVSRVATMAGQAAGAPYYLTGGLCENNDKFAVDRMLPEINIGDLLFIHDAGAHGFSMGYNYNGKLRSAELLLQEDGSVKMIRRAETPADYFATFDFGEYGPKLAEEAKIKM